MTIVYEAAAEYFPTLTEQLEALLEHNDHGF